MWQLVENAHLYLELAIKEFSVKFLDFNCEGFTVVGYHLKSIYFFRELFDSKSIEQYSFLNHEHYFHLEIIET